MSGTPFERCYWVREGRLLAGCYPGGDLDGLRTAGVTAIIDLTQEGELEPYAERLPGVGHRRIPIRDFGVPSADEMRRILDAIDEALAEGHVVYVHCWGGRGRTGTVVSCHLVRHGLAPDEALARVAELFAETGASGESPETPEQLAFVRGWRPGD